VEEGLALRICAPGDLLVEFAEFSIALFLELPQLLRLLLPSLGRLLVLHPNTLGIQRLLFRIKGRPLGFERLPHGMVPLSLHHFLASLVLCRLDLIHDLIEIALQDPLGLRTDGLREVSKDRV
jgi:hypothetical protein